LEPIEFVSIIDVTFVGSEKFTEIYITLHYYWWRLPIAAQLNFGTWPPSGYRALALERGAEPIYGFEPPLRRWLWDLEQVFAHGCSSTPAVIGA